ncbi:MAG: hypothetical protein EOO08_04350 [Chitinophagaceae bacterium]|nr:MAG: hypothetical protein EOO08_04350 [Chitinophagaceae bacterium]
MENSVPHSHWALPAIRSGLGKRQIRDLAKQSVERVLEEGHVFQVAEELAKHQGRIRVDHETGEVIKGAQKASRSTYRITLSAQ